MAVDPGPLAVTAGGPGDSPGQKEDEPDHKLRYQTENGLCH